MRGFAACLSYRFLVGKIKRKKKSFLIYKQHIARTLQYWDLRRQSCNCLWSTEIHFPSRSGVDSAERSWWRWAEEKNRRFSSLELLLIIIIIIISRSQAVSVNTEIEIEWVKTCFDSEGTIKKMPWSHLKAGQGDLKGNIQRPVHDSGYGLHEGHEEKREPHDADQQHHNHPSHSVLHHFLLLLASRLGVPLRTNEIRDVKDAPLRLCCCTPDSCLCKSALGTKTFRTGGPSLLKPVRHWTDIFKCTAGNRDHHIQEKLLR